MDESDQTPTVACGETGASTAATTRTLWLSAALLRSAATLPSRNNCWPSAPAPEPAASISAWSTRTSSACGLHEYVSSLADVAINFGSPPSDREVSSGRKEFLSLNFLNWPVDPGTGV